MVCFLTIFALPYDIWPDNFLLWKHHHSYSASFISLIKYFPAVYYLLGSIEYS